MPTAPTPVIPPASGSTPDTPAAIVPLPTGTPTAPGGITPAPDVSVSAPGTVVGAPDAMPDVPASIVEVATGTPTAPGSITPLPGGSASAPGSIVGAPDAMPDAPAPIVEVASGTPAPPEPASSAPIERSYPAGPPGLSAYEVAVQNGFEGTEEEWLASLAGAGSVRYDATQSLTTEQKTQARSNMGAAAVADIPTDILRYGTQSLSVEQQTQARANIGAAASSHTHSWASITGKPATFPPSSHTHSSDQINWVGGAIQNVITASLGSTDWQFVPENDPYRVIAAIDSAIGSGWQSSGGGGGYPTTDERSWYRPYMVNKLFIDNSANVTYSTMLTGTPEATIGGSAYPGEGVADGVRYLDLSSLNTSLGSNYGYGPIPSTVTLIYWNNSGEGFQYIFDALYACFWSNQVDGSGRVIDCSLGGYSTSNTFLLSDAQQGVLNQMMDAGWSILLPDMNMPNAAWSTIPMWPSYAAAENSSYSSMGSVTLGDGSPGFDTYGGVYYSPTTSTPVDASDFVFVGAPDYPRRDQFNELFYATRYYDGMGPDGYNSLYAFYPGASAPI